MSLLNIEANSFWDGLWKFLIIAYKDYPEWVLIFTGVILSITFGLFVWGVVKWLMKQSKISKIENHTRKLLIYFTGEDDIKGKKGKR